MSDDNLIGVDPLDWMNKQELDECKQELDECKQELSNNESDIDESGMDNNQSIKLESRFDIRMLDQVNESFKKLIDNAKEINIDISEVTKVDAASMQFLAAFKKTADEKLIAVCFENGNDYFLSSAKLLGLQEVLGLRS